MIFVRLAIGTARSGAFASMSVPAVRSAKIADRAPTAGGRIASWGVASAVGNGERLPFGGTGVGGGVAALGAASDVSATGPATSAATTPAATRRRRTRVLTRRRGGRAVRCGGGPA